MEREKILKARVNRDGMSGIEPVDINKDGTAYLVEVNGVEYTIYRDAKDCPWFLRIKGYKGFYKTCTIQASSVSDAKRMLANHYRKNWLTGDWTYIRSLQGMK